MPLNLLFILLTSVFLALALWTFWVLVWNRRYSHYDSENLKFVESFGYRVRFIQEGKGPHLILIHGIGASVYVWRFLIPLISKYFTVTAIDLLGFGWSEKPKNFKYDLNSQCDVIMEALKKLKIKNGFILGSSMGGAIALRLAQVHPDFFKKVVAISPAADPQIAYVNLKHLSFLTPFVQPIISERFIKQFLRRVVSKKSLITKESIQFYTAPYRSLGALNAFTKSFTLLKDPAVFSNLNSISQPTLILWGEKDKIIPIKYSKKIISQIPKAVLETHKSAGHHPQEDEPEWIASQIISFLS